jgi:xylulokinase
MTDTVIGIDSSTTSIKAIAWDSSGKKIAEGSIPLPLTSPMTGYYEQNADDWWNSTVGALKKITGKINKDSIKAVAVSNQRETFVGLDDNNNPVRPAIIWLDERCRCIVDRFAGIVGADQIHRITGKPKDYAPVVYRLAWMKEKENHLYKRVSKFCDVHTYLVYKLTGQFRTSWASADPMGIFDLERKIWAEDILKHLDINTDQLPVLYSPGTIIGNITRSTAELTGLKEGMPVIAGGGDGQAAGLGVNALTGERAYLNLGTAVVSGTYIMKYLVDKAFRTMASCSDNGYYCETSLRAGTFLIDWFLQKVLRLNPRQKKTVYDDLNNEAKDIPAGCEGLMVLPYWNAVMNPWWDPEARGCITGFSSGHNRSHIYRAILEGIAMEQSLATSLVEKTTGSQICEFAVIGGGAKNSIWKQIFADACNKIILSMETDEASSLGAGITAAVGIGWFSSFNDAAANMVHVKGITEPKPENVQIFKDLLSKYKKIYPSIRAI